MAAAQAIVPSKLSWHFQFLGTAVDAIAAASGASYIKVMDPPETNPFPGKQVIGRTYLDDGQSNALVAQGAAGADAWFERFWPIYTSRAYVTWWEGPNEPQDIYNQTFRKALVAFTLRLTERLHSIGRKIVALNLSVGAPDILEFMDFKGLAGKVDAVGLHEYSAPTMQSGAGWYCLRYRKYKAAWATAGLKFPPVLITECGIDGGVLNPPRPRTGWKSYASREAYLAQLQWYDAELAQDAEVLAATIFTSGPDGVWTDFDFDADLSRRLAAHIKAGVPPEVPPMTDPRAANCKRFHMDASNKVDGIELVYESRPDSPYQCVTAQLVTEADAQNNTVVTVEVFDSPGIRAAIQPKMIWPYGGPPAADSPAGPGNPKNEFNIGGGPYSPPTIGPLGFAVFDSTGKEVGDRMWGYGLPYNRHVGGYVAFMKRSVVVPPIDPTYPTFAASVRGEAERHDVLSVNPTAALCKAGAAAGLWPTSNEYAWTYVGVSYTGQRFRNPANDAVTAFYCVTGDWGNIKRQDW